MQTSFKTGDKAVYPGQGVGEVMGIEHTEVAGQRQSFYVLRILENGMRIMIPINKVGSVGLREIISEDDVKQVYSILKEKDISVDSTTWNRRYREYMEKIKTGSRLRDRRGAARPVPAQGRQGPLLRRAQDARHRALAADQGALAGQGVQRGRHRGGPEEDLQHHLGRGRAPGAPPNSAEEAREEQIRQLERSTRRRVTGVQLPVAVLCFAGAIFLLAREAPDVAYVFASPEPVTLGSEGSYHFDRLRPNVFAQVHGVPLGTAFYGVERGASMVAGGPPGHPADWCAGRCFPPRTGCRAGALRRRTPARSGFGGRLLPLEDVPGVP